MQSGAYTVTQSTDPVRSVLIPLPMGIRHHTVPQYQYRTIKGEPGAARDRDGRAPANCDGTELDRAL